MNQTQRSTTRGPDVIIGGSGRETRMAVRDAENPLYEELWEQEKEELKREHQRLLYVAMTRARDHLVMIGTRKDDKWPISPSTWLDYLHRSAPTPLFDSEIKSRSGIITHAYSAGIAQQEERVIIDTPRTDGPHQTPHLNIDIQTVVDNLAPIPPLKSPEWKRATDFIEHEKETTLELASLQTAPGAVSPLTRGSLLHRCLEDYTKSGSYRIDQIIGEYPDILSLGTEIVRQFVDEARSVLGRVMTNKELAWVFERGTGAYSELPFLYKKGNALVSGIIDRLVIRDGAGFVVDYKAIFIEDDETLRAWTDHYRPQVQVYCEAIKEMFRLPSVEGYVLFLDSSRLVLATKV
jgi:ATP-dependent helicase/nuclease subunit A